MKLLKSLRVVRSNKKKIESLNQASREKEKLLWLRNHRLGIEQDKRRQYSDEELLKVQRAHQKLQTEVILFRQECECEHNHGRRFYHHGNIGDSEEETPPHAELYRELTLILQGIKAFNHIQTERLLQEYQTDEEIIDRMLSDMSVPERVTLYRNVFKCNNNHCIFPSSSLFDEEEDDNDDEVSKKNYDDDVDHSILSSSSFSSSSSSSSSQQDVLLQKLSRNDDDNNKVMNEFDDDCCTCAICFEKFADGTRTRRITTEVNDGCDDEAVAAPPPPPPKTVVWSETEECKHVFCEECIVDYFSQRSRKTTQSGSRIKNHPCPICRRDFCTLQKNHFVGVVASASTTCTAAAQ